MTNLSIEPRCADNSFARYDPGKKVRQETWRAMELLVRLGKVRAIGLSDFTIEQLGEVLESAVIRPAVHQVQWGPDNHDDQMWRYLQAEGIAQQAFGALGLRHPGTWEHVQRIADAHSAPGGGARSTTAAQVALKWSLQQGVFALVGSSNPAHLKANLDVFDWSLSADELREISVLTPSIVNPAHLRGDPAARPLAAWPLAVQAAVATPAWWLVYGATLLAFAAVKRSPRERATRRGDSEGSPQELV